MGIPVWVSKFSSALDLISEANSKGIRLLQLNDSDQALAREFELLLRIKSDYILRHKLMDLNNELIVILVNSWLKLISK